MQVDVFLRKRQLLLVLSNAINVIFVIMFRAELLLVRCRLDAVGKTWVCEAFNELVAYKFHQTHILPLSTNCGSLKPASLCSAAPLSLLFIPLMGTLKPHSNVYTLIRWLLHWPLMGGLLHLVQRGGAWAGCGSAQSLLAVPNVTAHPSTATVPTSLLNVAL